LTGANLGESDLRGSEGIEVSKSGAVIRNTIHQDGSIRGLDLARGQKLVVRDYAGSESLPITVQRRMILGGGTLQLELAEDDWNSVIGFGPGIPVMLGGTLELTFAPEVDVASQIGKKITLFDWSVVNPDGEFDVVSDYRWDLSNLYRTGEVTLLGVLATGDFNADNVVDGADVDLLCGEVVSGGGAQRFDLTGDGQVTSSDVSALLTRLATLPGDADFDGEVQFSDFVILAATFGEAGSYSDGDFDCDGQVALPDFVILVGASSASTAVSVPEPHGLWLFCAAFLASSAGIRRVQSEGAGGKHGTLHAERPEKSVLHRPGQRPPSTCSAMRPSST
jgi:hypothetical protein